MGKWTNWHPPGNKRVFMGSGRKSKVLPADTLYCGAAFIDFEDTGDEDAPEPGSPEAQCVDAPEPKPGKLPE